MRAGTLSLGLAPLFVLSLGACEIGGGGGEGPDVNPDDPVRVPSTEEGVDSRLDALGIICESTLTVSGTFDETRTRPTGMDGCWEVGIWSVNWEIDFEGCDPQPDFPELFVYEAKREGEDNEDSQVFWQDDLEYDRLNLKVSHASDGLCHASFEHFGLSADGDMRIVVTLQPTLQADGTLSGAGAWSLWEEDPF